MSKQIAVRLPDDLVAFLDEVVSCGARSRASVVIQALERERRHRVAAADIEILESIDGDPYPDLAPLVDHGIDLDLD